MMILPTVIASLALAFAAAPGAAHWITAGETNAPAAPRYYETGDDTETAQKFYQTIAGIDRNRASVRMRKCFTVGKPVAKAVLTGTGLGLYEFYLNGNEVDADHLFKPIKTTYQLRVACGEYDVTPLIREGENAFGIEVAHGWFSPQAKYRGWRMAWSGLPMAAAELKISFQDGSSMRVSTGDDWRWAYGAVRFNCLYDGETYDPRGVEPVREWTSPGFDDSHWKTVKTTASPTKKLFRPVAPDDKVWMRIPPVAPPEPVKGRENIRFYDFGKNIAGRIRVKAGGGAVSLRIRHAENLAADGSGIDPRTLRKARGTVEMHLSPGEEYAARFTYTTFRYAEIEVVSGGPVAEVTAEAIASDVERCGIFECGDPLIMKIHEASALAFRNNLRQGVVTDCPQRDERLGWLGDVFVSAGQSWCNFDMAGIYSDWLDSVIALQTPAGDIPIIAPSPVMEFDLGYSACSLPIAWEAYRATGDKAFLTKIYEPAAKHARYFLGRRRQDGTFHSSIYGDWGSYAKSSRNPEWKKGSPDCMPSLMAFRFLSILADISSILGKGEENKWRDCAGEVGGAARRKWYDEKRFSWDEGLSGVGANALAVWSGIHPDKERREVFATVMRLIEKSGGGLTSGFFGTAAFFETAKELADPAKVWKILKRGENDIPSYASMLAENTTLCEWWNVAGGSRCHHAFSSVEVWLYGALAGVDVDFSRKEEVLLYRPHPVRECGFARASRRLPGGELFSGGWRFGVDGKVTHEVSVPLGYSVRVIIGGEDKGAYASGRHSFRE